MNRATLVLTSPLLFACASSGVVDSNTYAPTEYAPTERATTSRHEAVSGYPEAGLAFQGLDDGLLTEDDLGNREGGFFPREWLPRGWFVAGTANQFISSREGSDLERDLLQIGQVAKVSFDSEALGGKLLIGYQFEAPIAVEFGYTSMGEIETDISLAAPVSPTLSDDISNAHPILGDGFTLAMRANIWGRGPFTLTARVGAWAWDADKNLVVKTPTGSQSVKIDERGFDLFYGVGAIFGNWGGFSGLLEYDRYFLDGDGVDSISIGVLYGFGK